MFKPWKVRLFVVGVVTMSLVIGLMSGSVALAAEKKLTFYLIAHGPASSPFWGKAALGFREFGEAFGVDARFLGSKIDGDVGEMLANLENVVAAGGGDGVAMAISDPDLLSGPALKLQKMGVPSIAINVKDIRPEGQRIPYLRYVGEDSYNVGVANGKKVLAVFKEKAGRAPKHSLWLNHAPGVIVLRWRADGVKDVLTPEGTTWDEIDVTMDPSVIKEAVRAYVEKHPDTETIHTGGSTVAWLAAEQLKEMGKLGKVNEPYKPGNVYVGGVDVEPEIRRRIMAGEVVCTIDQQPYLQGFYGGLLLYHWVTHKFLPAADISTGPFVIDINNAKELLKEAEKGYRG